MFSTLRQFRTNKHSKTIAYWTPDHTKIVCKSCLDRGYNSCGFPIAVSDLNIGFDLIVCEDCKAYLFEEKAVDNVVFVDFKNKKVLK